MAPTIPIREFAQDADGIISQRVAEGEDGLTLLWARRS